MHKVPEFSKFKKKIEVNILGKKKDQINLQPIWYGYYLGVSEISEIYKNIHHLKTKIGIDMWFVALES